MAFAAPTIILPRDGSTWVDPLSPILLQKSEPWGATDTTEDIWFTGANGSSLLYTHGWSNDSRLLDGNTGTFADATAGGAIACYSPGNLSFSASSALYVKQIRMRLVLKKTYSNSPWADMIHFYWYHSNGTEMNVRGDLNLPIDRVTGSNSSATNTENGTSEWAAEYPTTIFFRRALASVGRDRFPISYLKAALLGSRLVMRTHKSPAGYADVSKFEVAAVGLRIHYWDPTPSTQKYYHFQVAEDNTFAVVDYDSNEFSAKAGDGNYHTIPPRALKPSSNTTYYVRARAHDGTGWSGYTASPISFGMMSVKAAEMFHDSASMINIVSQTYPPYTVNPGRWLEDAVYTNTYYIDLDRADFWPEMVISGMEENGVDMAYTEYKKAAGRYTEAEILTAVNTSGNKPAFYLDEENNQRLYVHTSTSQSPGAFDGFGIIFKITVSESNTEGGSADNEPSINRLMAVQDLSDHIDLWPEGKRAISSCRFTYNNADGWWYNKFFPGEHHMRTDGCWMWNGARQVIKAVGTSNAGELDLDDAPILFDGNIKLDGSSIDNKTLALEAQSKTLLPSQKWPKGVWSKAQYPDMSNIARNSPQWEVIGADHERVLLFWVNHAILGDTTNTGLARCWGREIHNPTDVYRSDWDDPIPSGDWSFNDSTQIFTVTGSLDANWPNLQWSCDCDGLKYSGTVAESTGDIATVFYTDENFGDLPSTAIDSTSFGELSTIYPGEIRYLLNQPRKANEILNEFMKTARCTFYTWFDGKIYASLDIGDRSSRPLIPDQNTVILFESDIDHDGCKWRIDMKNLANQMSYNFWTYPEPNIPTMESVEYIGVNELLKAKYKIDNQATGEVWKKQSGGLDTDDGIQWMNWNRDARCGRALPIATIPVYRKAWLVRPGQPLIAYMRTTPGDGPGVLGGLNKDGEYQAGLFIVLTARKNLQRAGGIIEAAFIEEMVGWKKDCVPRIE